MAIDQSLYTQVRKFEPKASEIIRIQEATIYHFLRGNGAFSVDFNPYCNYENRIIYLEPGQVVQFKVDGFVVREIQLPQKDIFSNQNFRVLFKHLISLGYIDFEECADCKRYLDENIISEPLNFVDISAKHWFWKNPFKASESEYHLIFDTKELIDQHFRRRISNETLIAMLGKNYPNVYKLYTGKLGLTLKRAWLKKRWDEIKKELAFSDQSIKEIAYNYEYGSPANFSTAFAQVTGKTPSIFRNEIEYQPNQKLISNLFELLDTHHIQHKDSDFYAQELGLSTKHLNRKLREELNTTLAKLIANTLVSSAKELLDQTQSVQETAVLLHFSEAHHFSRFFKQHVGSTPTEFLQKKP
ncbi:MAG: helix-turn-helix domain-containing protein [Luteibaculum sp.]